MGVKMEGKYYGPVGLVVEGNIYDSGREILTPEEAEEYIRRLQSRMHELYWDFFINLPGLCFLLSFLLFLATSFNYWILDELGINGLLRLLVFAPVLVSALCFCWRNQPVAAELEWAAAQKKKCGGKLFGGIVAQVMKKPRVKPNQEDELQSGE